MTTAAERSIRLGLIGDKIKRSKSPLLHCLAGRLCGFDIRYESLIPAELGCPFDAVFEQCENEGYRGINITYPYKETVVAKLRVADQRVAAIGACNTVLFGEAQPSGFNTDYSGFVAAFQTAFPAATPGSVAMAGAGGVGKAIGFALADLGAASLRLFDTDRPKAEKLANSLAANAPGMAIVIGETIEEAASGADGLINCTPIGMDGNPGTAIPRSLMRRPRWAFDAVYTPVDTEFLLDARRCGLETISGHELFFYQGLHAFHIFTGHLVDVNALQAAFRRLS